MSNGRIKERQAATKGGNSRVYGSGDGRPRPPGPEERGGATATRRNEQEDKNKPGSSNLPNTMRSSRFWIILLTLLALNWFLAPLLFPQTTNRIEIPYSM